MVWDVQVSDSTDKCSPFVLGYRSQPDVRAPTRKDKGQPEPGLKGGDHGGAELVQDQRRVEREGTVIVEYWIAVSVG